MLNGLIKATQINDDKDREMIKACLELFHKIDRKIITQDEFNKEMVYLVMFYTFDRIVFKPLPSRPFELVQFEGMGLKEREEFIKRNPGFHTEIGSPVKRYIEKRDRVQAANSSNLWWLKELQGYAVGDPATEGKIVNRIKQFEELGAS